MNYSEQIPDLTRQLLAMSQTSKSGSLGATLIDLVNIRASLLNGCAFCYDMHVKEAKIHGERDLRIYHVSIWRESSLFSEKERAALEWTETVTQLPSHGIPDEIYQSTRKHFSEKEIAELTFAIGIINMWNRLGVSFRSTPGSLDAMLGLEKAGLK
jgi:AhpD family alkylhydroperoxidase